MALRIFVTGPGDTLADLRKALIWGEQVRDNGMVPYISHFHTFWEHMAPPTSQVSNFRETMDTEWLQACHALYVFGPIGSGKGNRLGRQMEALNRPTFHLFNSLCTWAKSEEQRLRKAGLWDEQSSTRQILEFRPSIGRKEYWERTRAYVQALPAVGGSMLPSIPVLPGCPGHDPIRARETGPMPDWDKYPGTD